MLWKYEIRTFVPYNYMALPLCCSAYQYEEVFPLSVLTTINPWLVFDTTTTGLVHDLPPLVERVKRASHTGNSSYHKQENNHFIFIIELNFSNCWTSMMPNTSSSTSTSTQLVVLFTRL